MNKNIETYVESFFEDIPYSKKSYEAKEKILDKLNTKYEEEKEKSKIDAFEKVVSKYNTLYKLADLVGYTKNDVNKWKEKKDIIDLELAKKSIKEEIKYHNVQAIFIFFFITHIFNMIFTFVTTRNTTSCLVSILFAELFGYLIIRKYKKYNSQEKKSLSIDALLYYRKYYDKYSKKKTNTLFIIFIVLSFYLMNIINLSINSKLNEVLEYVYYNSSIIEFIIAIFIKNIMITKDFHSKLEDKVTQNHYKYMKVLSVFSLVYWILVSTLELIFKFKYYVDYFLIVLIIYLVVIIIYDLKYRKNATYKNIVINKLKITLYTLIILIIALYNFLSKDVWLTQPYINSVPNIYDKDNKIEYDERTGVYTITKAEDDFKILQVTDIHLGGGVLSYDKDLKALKTVYDLLDYTKPDLVVITGDLTFPVGISSFSINNYTPVMQFASFMRNLGVPWAFTYGNHDTESMAKYSSEELNELYMSLSYKTSKTLLYPYIQPGISGRNNQYIKIKNSDGSLNQLLFLIDSNAYTGEGFNKYDYIHDDQVEWYSDVIKKVEEEEGKIVPSMLFFHIPIEQYRTAYELYEEGSDEVTYYFGSNDEKMFNKVCTSDYPSKIFDEALKLGSTKAIFCGHDHYNNMSLEYKGIRLTYGMSVDYLAIPGIANDTK